MLLKVEYFVESAGVRYLRTCCRTKVKQRARKCCTKHFPCGTVFIIYLLRHSTFCQPFIWNLHENLKSQNMPLHTAKWQRKQRNGVILTFFWMYVQIKLMPALSNFPYWWWNIQNYSNSVSAFFYTFLREKLYFTASFFWLSAKPLAKRWRCNKLQGRADKRFKRTEFWRETHTPVFGFWLDVSFFSLVKNIFRDCD